MSETEPASPPATPRQHAYTGPAQPHLPEPTHAERVRTLLTVNSVGILSTLSQKHPGFPFGSLMPYALDPSGRPLLLISNMAMHTQNLKSDPHASLFVSQLPSKGDPLGAARATLVGQVDLVPPSDLADARELYLARHENSRYWVDFTDFGLFRIEPRDLYYVGGFGVMGWVAAADFASAEPDPLSASAPAILAHMNADHESAMILIAHKSTGLDATAATMTSVDRLGFSLRLTTPDGIKGPRFNFPREVRSSAETREALVEMVQRARSGAGNLSSHVDS